MQEYATGQLFMYGGMGADGKPLNDAYLLEWDGASWLWSCIYSGHSELVPPTGAIATLMDRRLVTMSSAAGSSKLDVVQSLDILQVGQAAAGSAAATGWCSVYTHSAASTLHSTLAGPCCQASGTAVCHQSILASPIPDGQTSALTLRTGHVRLELH